MRLPRTLFLYIGRYFLAGILIAWLGLMGITMLIDTVELIRRTAGKDQVTTGVIIQMVLLHVPHLSIKLVPYAVLIGSMLALTRLTRTHELIVARSSGISVWQFLMPAVIVVMGLGVILATAYNPIASLLLLRYEQMEDKYFTGRGSFTSLSSSGLWLRQVEDKGEHIIHAARISQKDMSLRKVVIFTFNDKRQFAQRMDVERAVLEDGVLRLHEVSRSVPGMPVQKLPEVLLPTSLTMGYIQDSFASPETLSFWYLPSFIDMLEQAGFSALRHKLYWLSLLSSPFLLAGTVLIAAVFSLRLPRRGKIGILVVAGIITGFLMHFFTDIIFALGAAGTIPVLLAALAPAAVAIMIGAVSLLHLEDG